MRTGWEGIEPWSRTVLFLGLELTCVFCGFYVVRHMVFLGEEGAIKNLLNFRILKIR